MSASKEKSGKMVGRLKSVLSTRASPRQKQQEVAAPPAAAAGPAVGQAARPAVPPVAFGRDPRLSKYISSRCFNRPEGIGVQEVLRALADAVRSNDKAGRAQLVGLLLRLFFFEEVPPEAVQLLVPLFQAQGKDVRALRSLYYLAETYVSCGCAGTPTLYDPALLGKRPDEKALQAVLAEVWRLLDTPALDPAVARASFYLAGAAARANPGVRKQLAAAVQRAIAEADEAAAGAGGPLGAPPAGKSLRQPARRSAANDWDLQHTVFGASRLAGAATGSDEISRSFAVGVGSADPVGARHALAMGVDVAFRDASYVVREMYPAVSQAAQQYEAAGLGIVRSPGQGVNLEDGFARLYLARLCAAVVHSDQAATDVARDGAPFWQMLCLLATRDPVDLVRFGAIEAMTGALSASAATLSGSSKPGSAREDTVQRQRRGRAWRLLVAQAGLEITVPGATDKGAMKLIDVLGRLLLLALRKTGSAARFCVAAGAVASLAESCLASQTVGSTRHGSSPDVDRVLGVLAGELSGAVEGSLSAAQRCSVIEALLYLQAAGYPTTFSPAKLAQAAGNGGAAWTGGMQDALLTAVLKCAKAKPREAARFLGYATGVVGIAPSGIDLTKITDLWDAAVASGREGKEAVLAVAMDALQSPPPPSTQARAGSTPGEVTRAAREEDGWNAFVATAAWWLGENANSLCEEYAGRNLSPAAIPASVQAAAAAAGGGKAAAAADAGNGVEGEDEDDDDEAIADREADAAAAAAVAAASTSAAELLQQFGGRSPTLSRILLALQGLMLTAVWQLRLAAAQALAKIAVRSGEPYRLQCYSILAAACSAGTASGDALGLGSVTRPALALLDRVYAAQVVLDQLWGEHGEDPEAWPKEVLASLARRNAELARQAERYVCSVPRERYSLLGHRAAVALAGDAEAGDYFSSFLKEASSEKEAPISDRVGEDLKASKSREVDAILGSAASDEGGSLTFKGAFSEASATLDDRNKEIDRLLSGGGQAQAAPDPWAFATTASSSFNAFAEGGAAAPAFASSTSMERESETPKFGAQPASSGSGDWGAAGRAASPDAAAAGSADWFGRSNSLAGEGAGAAGSRAAAAKVIGTGTVLHTFVGDYNQPEELSVFEGDKVEVLEEADGWMLVRDPSGREGLVPTSYLHLDQLYQQNLQSAAAAEAAAAAAEYQRKAAGTPTRAHRRGASVDFGQSKEDLLDNIFSSYQSNQFLPTMPEEQPASFGESASFFGAGASSSSAQSYAAPSAAAGPSSGDFGGGTGGSLSPVARQDSFTTATGRTDSMWAAQPLRQDSVQRPSDYPEPSAAAGSSPRAGLIRQTSSAAAQSPGAHTPSGTGSAAGHRRTLSGASSGGAGGFDAYADLGSMPNTPSRVDGPERGIVAGFVGELEGELTVEPGDRVKVHSEVDGWARIIRLSDNRTGLVPSWAVGTD